MRFRKGLLRGFGVIVAVVTLASGCDSVVKQRPTARVYYEGRSPDKARLATVYYVQGTAARGEYRGVAMRWMRQEFNPNNFSNVFDIRGRPFLLLDWPENSRLYVIVLSKEGTQGEGQRYEQSEFGVTLERAYVTKWEDAEASRVKSPSGKREAVVFKRRFRDPFRHAERVLTVVDVVAAGKKADELGDLSECEFVADREFGVEVGWIKESRISVTGSFPASALYWTEAAFNADAVRVELRKR